MSRKTRAIHRIMDGRGWGGWRSGAGRPAIPKAERRQSLTVSLDPAICDWLKLRAQNEKQPISHLVENTLRRSMLAAKSRADR